jgi:hypothetical protein
LGEIWVDYLSNQVEKVSASQWQQSEWDCFEQSLILSNLKVNSETQVQTEQKRSDQKYI